MRSLLFVPGNKENMLTKALGTRPDVLVPDMEDSVPDTEKETARRTIAAFLTRLASTGALLVPRVNALDTEWHEADLAAVIGPEIHGVSVGKIRRAGDIAAISALIARFELRAGIAVGHVRLIPWIETAEAIVNCREICAASDRIIAVAFGAEDFTNDMGIDRLDDESQLAHARSALCIAARAAGVAALDTPYFRFRDRDGLERNARAAKHVGFKGKFAIHPEQLDALDACFSPSPDEIAEAERIVAA
ncbi:MAG: CoA ester lyase, partial [Gammaproteobacteria bacterium]|nr:CoA ester lyase [Gammaproteobacteria bacterium]